MVWGPLWQTPLGAGTARQRDIWNLVYLTGHQVHHGKCNFQMMETRENIFDGHKAEPLGHKTKLKKKSHSFFM